MLSNYKIPKIVLCLVLLCVNLSAHAVLNNSSRNFVVQIDSLIHEKRVDYGIAQLDLLILYDEALAKKHADSIKIFKKLALLNAELEQPKDAHRYTVKYINNTLDFSILKNESYKSINKTPEYKALKDQYITDVNTLAFVYFYAALIGFFFSITIKLTKKSNKYTKIFIALFVSANSLFILEFVLFMTKYQYQFPHSYRMSAASALLFGPLLYFYFKSIIKPYKFKAIHLLHFLPTIVLLTFLFPMYFSSANDKVRMMLEIHSYNKVYDSVIFISKMVSLSVYAFFIGKLLFNQKKKHVKLQVNRWKKIIYKIYVAYVVSYLVYGISVFGVLGAISSFIYHIQMGAMSALVIYIAYMAYVQPDIFKAEYVPSNKRLFSEKYQNSGLTEALSKELKESLIALFVEGKVYKKNNLNLDILADMLNTTRHNTSQIINEHFKMNFFELINTFRIQEAIRLLKEDVHGNLNIIDIAYEVGYNNKVTFNKAFKKETSLTPSEFIQSELQNHQGKF